MLPLRLLLLYFFLLLGHGSQGTESRQCFSRVVGLSFTKQTPRGGGHESHWGSFFQRNDDADGSPKSFLRRPKDASSSSGSSWGREPSSLTNPLNPIFTTRQEKDRVVFTFDLPSNVSASDLTVDVDHKRAALHVQGRRWLGKNVEATTMLDQEIPLDENVLNVHIIQVQHNEDSRQLSIVVFKRQRMQRLSIETVGKDGNDGGRRKP